jgi:hypothetical protein
MMLCIANPEHRPKSRAIFGGAMSFHTSADDANSTNHRATSMAQFPDDVALNLPRLSQ